MITLLVLLAYVVPMFPTTLRLVRWHADNDAFCHSNVRSHYENVCRRYDPPDCWRADRDKVDAYDLVVAPLAFIWPLLLIGSLIIHYANKKPSRHMLEQRIKRLEKEAGL